MAQAQDTAAEVDALVAGLSDEMLLAFLWDVLQAPAGRAGDAADAPAQGERHARHSAAMS